MKWVAVIVVEGAIPATGKGGARRRLTNSRIRVRICAKKVVAGVRRRNSCALSHLANTYRQRTTSPSLRGWRPQGREGSSPFFRTKTRH